MLDIYTFACGHLGVIPKTDTAKHLVKQVVSQIRETSATLIARKQEMQSLTDFQPEYPVTIRIFEVGHAIDPELMAKIGDVRCFYSIKARFIFAGIDTLPYQSVQMDVSSRSISKR